MRLAAILAFLCLAASAQDNQLTTTEKAAGWRLLFDGKSMTGWRDPAAKVVPGSAWTIEDGALTTVLKPRIEEDLISRDSFTDFELQFDWKVAPRGNTGLKYRLQREIFVDQSTVKPGPNGFAGILANGVPGAFEVRNELVVN